MSRDFVLTRLAEADLDQTWDYVAERFVRMCDRFRSFASSAVNETGRESFPGLERAVYAAGRKAAGRNASQVAS